MSFADLKRKSQTNFSLSWWVTSTNTKNDMDKKQLLEDKFMTAARFSQEVEKIAFDNPDMNYIDSVIHYCEVNEIELDSVGKLVS